MIAPRRGRRVALVTGAGARLGRAVALDLAAHGYTVAAHYRASPPPRGLVALRADLADPTGVDALAAAFRDRFDRLDLLVASAGAYERRTLSGTDAALFDALMAVNARAPLLLARALAPLLRRSRGSLVALADVGGGLRPWRDHAAYCASKAALARVTECLALELAPQARANAVAPGIALWHGDFPAKRRRELTRRVPLGRAGTPADVAQAVRYLADAPYVTGVILAVDGGRHLGA